MKSSYSPTAKRGINADLTEMMDKKKSKLLSVEDLSADVEDSKRKLKMSDSEVLEEMKRKGQAVVGGVSLIGNNEKTPAQNRQEHDPFFIKPMANKYR